jgi:hypothetical protein
MRDYFPLFCPHAPLFIFSRFTSEDPFFTT